MESKGELVVCSDHVGYKLKEYLKNRLEKEDIRFIDLGVYNEERVDYPDIASKGAKVINSGKYKKGIFICGSGVGASIAANRYKGVRAVLAYNKKAVILSRQHNDSNVIVFGGKLINSNRAFKLFIAWWNTGFSNEERHALRVAKLDKIGK